MIQCSENYSLTTRLELLLGLGKIEYSSINNYDIITVFPMWKVQIIFDNILFDFRVLASSRPAPPDTICVRFAHFKSRFQLLSWNTKTTSWTSGSSTAPRIRTGCPTSWTCSLGRCRLSERKVRRFVLSGAWPFSDMVVLRCSDRNAGERAEHLLGRRTARGERRHVRR